ncbi:MAG: hypothetical protein GTN74_08590 [Proteobacteria bacterium]|nr:hypothetical protein [Pseudomonadota bacterium]NIS69958.1 hypothetical protein [Pseudomonadota bacterium]
MSAGIYEFPNTLCLGSALSFREGNHILDERGTIQRVSPGSAWYVIVPDYDKMQRFAPINLPEDFRRDGLRVLFSGRIGEIPANVRLVGTPLEITRIETLDWL